MRSLKQYITESVHTYDYTVKIAGQIDKNWLDLFKHNLKKFDPIEMSEPKTTPIQKSPYGFNEVTNEPVTLIKCKFRYPATEPMVQQIAQLLGYNVNMVRLVRTGYDESVTSEMEGYENQMDHSPVLTHEELEEQPGAKEAAKAYGNSYLDSIKEQTKDDKIEIPYEGTKTPAAFDPFKPETLMATMGKDSPMSKITRPAKPQTGAMGGR
jgi:hypothetical protein